MCDRGTLDAAEALAEADVTFLCTAPSIVIRYLKEYKGGVQAGQPGHRRVRHQDRHYEGLPGAAPQVDFIGCHPMAGTEFSGIEHSFPELFQRCHFILTPGTPALRATWN